MDSEVLNTLPLLFKATVKSVQKWIKYEDGVLTYSGLINAVKNKFSDITSEDEWEHAKIKDDTGGIIEPDIFDAFITSQRSLGPFIIILDSDTAPQLHRFSAQNNCESPLEKNVLQESINKVVENAIFNQLPDIYEEYNNLNGDISVQKRKTLTNKIVDEMVKYGRNLGYRLPPKDFKTRFAKAVVKFLPGLRDPNTTEGHEIFYDSETGKGFFEIRLKNYYRGHPVPGNEMSSSGIIDRGKHAATTKMANASKKLKTPASTNPKSPRKSPKKRSLLDIEEELNKLKADKDVVALMDYHPQKHYLKIKEKMFLTYELRRNMILDRDLSKHVFQIFPRFLDTPNLISDDFDRLHPDKSLVSKFNGIKDKIFTVYARKGRGIWRHLIEEQGYNTDIKAFIALIALLDKKIHGKNKADTLHSFLVFRQTGLPLNTNDMKVPLLIAEGENLQEITSYWLSVDGKIILLPENDFPSAVDVYFKSFFVFDIAYPKCLENFLKFIESTFFELNVKNISPIVREIRASLSRLSDQSSDCSN